MYRSTRDAAKQLGVHANTLRNWARNGKIRHIITPFGQRRYDVSSVCASGRRRLLYARVSTRAQRPDLERQIQYLRSRYPDYELIEDVGSGLSFKRKGFAALLESIMQGEVEELVVAHRDRLCRFGFELFERVAGGNNCRIVVLDNTQLSPQDELVRDFVSIIHVFSCRLYGLRKYASKVSKDPDLPGRGEPAQVEEVPRT